MSKTIELPIRLSLSACATIHYIAFGQEATAFDANLPYSEVASRAIAKLAPLPKTLALRWLVTDEFLSFYSENGDKASALKFWLEVC